MMSEIETLEQYLIGHGIPYKSLKDDYGLHGRIHLYVYNSKGFRDWDAVCETGSEGYSNGLIEVWGRIANGNSDGNLTAQQIIKRI